MFVGRIERIETSSKQNILSLNLTGGLDTGSALLDHRNIEVMNG